MPVTSIKPFTLLLIAQSISIFGSSLTAFALGVWVYQEVGSTTIYALIAFANGIPIVLLSPFAGTIVDRANRKLIMFAAQAASFFITLFLMQLYWFDALMPWHIIALVALNSCFAAFLLPAVSATIPLMVPAEQLTRANGMIALAFGIIQLSSPAIAGSLYHNLGLKFIFWLDLLTFVIGLIAIALTYIPQPHTTIKKSEPIYHSMRLGLGFILCSKSLYLCIVFYALIAAILMSMGIMIQPMLLALTDAQTMGFVMSFAGSGILIGSACMILMKNVRFHVPIILLSTLLAGLACIITPMTKNIWFLAAGGFLIMFCYPFFEANNRALLQRKIDPAILGRVIGWRNFALGLAQSVLLIGAGLLADKYFEPAMQLGGQLSEWFGPIYGLGKGRGVALFLSVLGGFIVLVTVLAYLSPSLRKMDYLMNDHIEPEDEPVDNLMMDASPYVYDAAANVR